MADLKSAYDQCPDCGKRHVKIEIDLYEVVARWIIAYSNEPLPPGCKAWEVADSLRHRHRTENGECDRLVAAARAATQYVSEQIVDQYEMQTTQDVAGHA